MTVPYKGLEESHIVLLVLRNEVGVLEKKIDVWFAGRNQGTCEVQPDQEKKPTGWRNKLGIETKVPGNNTWIMCTPELHRNTT